jgi:hypothetical protein
VDIEMFKLLDSCAVSYQVILTKLDEVKKADRDACVADTLAQGEPLTFERAEVLPPEGYRRMAQASVVRAAFEDRSEPGHVTLTVFDPLSKAQPQGSPP